MKSHPEVHSHNPAARPARPSAISAALIVAGMALPFEAGAQSFTPSPNVPHDLGMATSPTVPYPTQTLTELATFAWQEFVALNYPADPMHRGQPLAGASLGDSADARVWESYWHRVEIFPFDEAPVTSSGAANTTARPTYKYQTFDFTATNFGGTGTAPAADALPWNNLDEDNELNVDEMFAHVSDPTTPTGFTNENRIIYEAKMNEVGANYVLGNNLYEAATRNVAIANSSTPAALMSTAGTCATGSSTLVSFPCGTAAGSEGHIEIKAAWMKLTADEMSGGTYYTNEVLRYEADSGTDKWYVDTYGLAGLHIIHKTENFPTFVFATFEHNDLIATGVGYTDEITETGRGSGDTAGTNVVITDRDNPIPADVAAVNTTVQAAISDTVFSNYQLVGVQAYPMDFSQIGMTNTVHGASSYYLANIVIESNEELQNFRGDKPAGEQDTNNIWFQDSSAAHVNKNMGGCMGCHGVAESMGADFSFLMLKAPFSAPEVVGGAGIIDFINVQNFTDVQTMFNSYLSLNGISVAFAPHMKKIWMSDPASVENSYQSFMTGNVPGVSGDIKIVDCGNAAGSNIVNVLMGPLANGIPEMPLNGPYFPEEQIENFAAWVDGGCPN